MYTNACLWNALLYCALGFNVAIQVYGHPIIGTRGSLRIPEAGPSWEHLSSERHIAIRPMERQEGGILPLQIYRSTARSKRQQPRAFHPSSYEEQKFKDTAEIMEYLAGVAQNPGQYNLSRTAQTMLSNLDVLSRFQCDQLVRKIEMEQKASQRVPSDALEIVYCDAHICVTNKPGGILSVPGPRRNPSLANLVYDTLQPENLHVDQMIVHRLDMATSGILVYALSLEALSKLHSDFKERRVQKTYQALVAHPPEQASLGALEGEITIDLERDPVNPPLMRIAQPKQHQGGYEGPDDDTTVDIFGGLGSTHKLFRQAPKECLTTWTLIRREVYQGQQVSRLDLRPWTGRTHQLRVHCAQGLGTPIVGDDMYGINDPFSKVSSPLCLHARQLCLHHPISGAPMIFEADPPF